MQPTKTTMKHVKLDMKHITKEKQQKKLTFSWPVNIAKRFIVCIQIP
jgi:hypothetical protein